MAENASTDSTVAVARRVAAELPGVEVLALPEAGRGRALRTAWLTQFGLVAPVEYEDNHHRHDIAPTPVGASGQSLH